MKTDRFAPYSFANGKTARNRVVVPPMASQTADDEGLATDRTIEHYRRLAASGAGIVFAEYSHVLRAGKGESNQLGAWSDFHTPGLARIAATIHEAGALAGLQLVHVGGKTTAEIAGAAPTGPSPIPVPVKGWQPPTPLALDEPGIASWIEGFVAAAGRARIAGFDLVELHAAHGYGLNQWLSPLTNQREDRHGGDLPGRTGLLFEIVTRIRSAFPALLIAVRIGAQDHLPGGLTLEDTAWVARELERLGVDLLDVSSGIGGWRRPEGRNGQGYLVNDAAALKTVLSIPVIGVGGIETGEFIDGATQERRLDFAAVGRAILKDPAAWGRSQLVN